jgi:nitrate reductase alpha subunit
VEVEELAAVIRSKLIDQTWFYHHNLKLPDLRTHSFDAAIDPTWHEFSGIELKDSEADAQLNLPEFLAMLR